MTDLALGSSDDLRVTPCCARLHGLAAWLDAPELTGWCHLPDGHDGECEGAMSTPPTPTEFGPKQRSKRP